MFAADNKEMLPRFKVGTKPIWLCSDAMAINWMCIFLNFQKNNRKKAESCVQDYLNFLH
jgi:hypothetical protein